MRLAVVGCGYLGVTLAAAMAKLGNEVIGVDVDAAKVISLNRGIAGFFEPDVDELLARHVATGAQAFTTSYREALDFSDVVFLTVGTPPVPGGSHYDLTHLRAAVRQIAAEVRRPTVVIGKSTVQVGTAHDLSRLIRHEYPGSARMIRVAWMPEFVRESSAVTDTLAPSRIVIGIEPGDKDIAHLVRKLHGDAVSAGTRFIVTNLATAELAKCAANAFLATKLSFINAMAELCEVAGGDVEQLAEVLASDPRIGPGGMRPGLGFGGGCLPKDIRAFARSAHDLGIPESLRFLQEVDAINLRRRDRVVDLAIELCQPDVRGTRVAVWGAAFKPGTDDIRDSPALAVADRMSQLGASVVVCDPRASGNGRSAHPQLEFDHCPTRAASGSHLLLHLTEWPDFKSVDPRMLASVVAQRNIIDARGSLDAASWELAGWTYRRLGNASPGHASKGASYDATFRHGTGKVVTGP
jgi:UDPglucose 6-dehydrogenase